MKRKKDGVRDERDNGEEDKGKHEEGETGGGN